MPKETYQLPKSLNCSNNRGEQVLFVLRKQFSLRCSYSLPSVTAEYCIDANTPQKAADAVEAAAPKSVLPIHSASLTSHALRMSPRVYA